MNCNICYQKPNINVPLLVCKHYICTTCYCKQKCNKINNCSICNQRLKRGKKLNY